MRKVREVPWQLSGKTTAVVVEDILEKMPLGFLQENNREGSFLKEDISEGLSWEVGWVEAKDAI